MDYLTQLKDTYNINAKEIDSVFIVNKYLVDRYRNDPSTPYIVSFPRTGSHWLLMLLEHYFKKPTMRVSFLPELHGTPEKINNFHISKFLAYHTHDGHCNERKKSALYLYRDPVETVYSKLQYDLFPFTEPYIIKIISEYKRHIRYWLDNDDKNVVPVYYGRLKKEFHREFRKVVKYLEGRYSHKKADETRELITKELVKERTRFHDNKAISISERYKDSREYFNKNFFDMVNEEFFKGIQHLRGVFSV